MSFKIKYSKPRKFHVWLKSDLSPLNWESLRRIKIFVNEFVFLVFGAKIEIGESTRWQSTTSKVA